MTNLPSALSETERALLIEHETFIEAGIASFVDVGERLLDISNKRLYRETHGSFDSYCREKWSMSSRRAYQLCDAARVVQSVNNCSQSSDLVNEAQVRALGQVPEEKRVDVLQKASKRGKVTAKAIQLAAEEEDDEPAHITTLDQELAELAKLEIKPELSPLEQEVIDALDVQTENDRVIRDCITGHTCDAGGIGEVILHCQKLAEILRKYQASL